MINDTCFVCSHPAHGPRKVCDGSCGICGDACPDPAIKRERGGDDENAAH